MKRLVKIQLTFKELFENFATIKQDDEIVEPKQNMFIKNSEGRLTQINGLIRKTNHDIIETEFSNGLKFRSSGQHLIKTNNGFKFIIKLDLNDKVLLYNNNYIYIRNNKNLRNSDYVYDISLKDNIHEYVTPNNLIHHNSTLARIITSTNGVLSNPKDNVLVINGSAKETRNINFVDTVIEPFLKIPPAGKDRWRIVYIDECDYLTDAAFNSLRGIIEKYQQKFGRFVCTCNYLSKVPEPIQSRFTPYIFKQIPIEFVGHYCKKILDVENIKYDDNDLKFIIDSLYPDVRRVIDFLQDNSIESHLNVDKNSILTTERLLISSMVEICNHVKGGETYKINKIVGIITNLLDEHDLEYRSVYTQLFFNKDIPVAAKIVINKYANSHRDCLVESMHFMGLVLEFIQTLSKYQQAVKEK